MWVLALAGWGCIAVVGCAVGDVVTDARAGGDATVRSDAPPGDQTTSPPPDRTAPESGRTDVVPAPDASGSEAGPTCAAPLVACGGACVDTQSDPSNCGGCGTRCAAGTLCSAGTCRAACMAPLVACGGACVNTQTDVANCGGCGVACAAGQTCATGACRAACSAPMTMCGAACVNTQSDPANCGACGVACAAGGSCSAGTCTGGPTRAAGAACTRASDCGGTGGSCAPPGFGWVGGYCLYPDCLADSDCGPSGVCLSLGPGVTACFRRCSTRADCRTGYTCAATSSPAVRYCSPACSTNPAVVCGPYRCDSSTDECVGGCFGSTDCSPGSFCSGGQCVCTAATSCGAGLTCYPSYGGCGCATDAVCGPGSVCNRTDGSCS